MGVLAAERIKLTSTKSPMWCTALTVVAALGIIVLFSLILNAGADAHNSQGGEPGTGAGGYADNSLAGIGITGAAQGMPGFGYILIMILATLAITSEYRFGTIKTTFLAVPNRTTVLVAKAGLIAAAAAVLSVVLTFLSFFLMKAILSADEGRYLSLNHNLHIFYAVPIFVALVVFLAVGVGALIRQSAGALSLLIVWPVVVEPIVGAFGKWGREIQVFLPFQNAGRFIGSTDGGGQPWHWGQWGALLYFACIVALVFGAAVYVVNKRDA